MLSSITPLGEGGKGNRYRVTAGAHVIGSSVGGVALGFVAGAPGAAVRSAGGGWFDPLWVLGSAALGAVVVDTFVAPRRPLPCWHRQVNERWLDEYRGWVYGAAFGLQLGMGVVTIITSATAYAVVIAVGAQPTLGASVVVGATFGTARGLMVLAVRHVKAPGQLAAFHRRFAAAAVTAGRVASGAAAIVGLVGLGLAAGST